MISYDLKELAERCEAEEGSRLDGDIAEALKLCPQEERWRRNLSERHYGTVDRPDEWYVPSQWWDGEERWPSWRSPRFTRSMDAALTLVPADWKIHILSLKYGKASACLHRAFGSFEADEVVWRENHSWSSEHMTVGDSATLARALCAAAIRTRLKTMEKAA